MIRIVKPEAKEQYWTSSIEPSYKKSDTIEIDIAYWHKRWEDFWANCMPFSEFLEEIAEGDYNEQKT